MLTTLQQLDSLPFVKTNPDYIYDAVVSRWIDGDTIDLDIVVRLDLGFHYYETKQFKLRFRLRDVDTPERGQVNWAEATAMSNSTAPVGTFVKAAIYKMPTSYMPTGTLGRYVAYIYTPSGDSVGDVLIATGLAKVWTGS